MLLPKDFNPRSHERSDIRVSSSASCTSISIHAPTRGATEIGIKLIQICSISIHAPTRGATLYSCGSSLVLHISIHAPTRGATRQQVIDYLQGKNFNPRSHERSDVDKAIASPREIIFQSTLPREERHYCRPLCRNFRDFNPRSHERSDIPELPTEDEQRNFNPRSHERSDPNVQHMAESFTNFNPRSHERSDCCDRLASALVIYFNPRSHERSD